MIRKTTPERLSFFPTQSSLSYHGAGFRTASTGATYLRSSPGALADMVKLRGQLLVHRDRLGQSSLLAALRQGSHAAFDVVNFAHLFSVSLLPLSTASMAVSRLSSQPVAFYAAVLHQAFAEYQSLYTAEAFAITTPTPAEIEQRWNEGPIWSVVKDGRLVGTVAAVAKGDALYIRSMAVVPSARGQGIGKILLVAVENFARDGGLHRMLLSTTPFLDDAIRLYQRFGFDRIREGRHDLAGTPLFTMEKAVR